MRENRSNLFFALEVFAFCIALCVIILSLCICFSWVSIEDDIDVANEKSVAGIIIDAGHGGRDGGASDANGVLEKDLNLSVARTLRDILLLCDFDVIMTRDSDSLVCDENAPGLKGKIKMTDLNNRLKISRENPDSVFVSVHMNKFPIEKYSGLQVYYSPNNESSFTLAKAIQDKTVEVLQPSNTRKVKRAGSNIFLLDRITAPAVLIECGFLSNREEAEKLCSNEYRAKLALIFAESILGGINNLGIIYPNA